jgi:hypothetical protein
MNINLVYVKCSRAFAQNNHRFLFGLIFRFLTDFTCTAFSDGVSKRSCGRVDRWKSRIPEVSAVLVDREFRRRHKEQTANTKAKISLKTK